MVAARWPLICMAPTIWQPCGRLPGPSDGPLVAAMEQQVCFFFFLNYYFTEIFFSFLFFRRLFKTLPNKFSFVDYGQHIFFKYGPHQSNSQFLPFSKFFLIPKTLLKTLIFIFLISIVVLLKCSGQFVSFELNIVLCASSSPFLFLFFFSCISLKLHCVNVPSRVYL